MPSLLHKLSTPWEREMGLIYIETFENDAAVEKNMGTPTNAPTISNGLVLSGAGTQHVVTRIPPSLFYAGVNEYLTFAVEFTTPLAYDALVQANLFQTTAGNLFYFLKRSSDGDIRIAAHSTVIDFWEPATIQNYWVQNGRNQIVFSFKSGDSHGWLNGTKLTDADGTTFTATNPTEIYHGISNAVGDQWNGTILSLKVFKSTDRFYQEDVNRLWSLDKRDPRDRAAAHWPLNAGRGSVAQTLDVTRNARHMTLGDGIGGATAPTKLADRAGYSFDGGDYLTGSTLPAITSGESVTLEVAFKLDPVAGFHGLITRGLSATNLNLNLRVDDGKPEFYFRQADDSTNRQWETTGDPIQFNTWYHFIFRHTFGDATSTGLFINGVEEPGAWVSGGDQQPLENVNHTWQLGDRGPGDQEMTGDIYLASVWEDYLSLLEIKELWVTARQRMNLDW